jgi:hypothetical protein
MIYHRDTESTELQRIFLLLRKRKSHPKFPIFSVTPCSLCLGGKIISSVPFFSLCPRFYLRPSFLVAVFFLAVIFEGVFQLAGELGIQLL